MNINELHFFPANMCPWICFKFSSWSHARWVAGNAWIGVVQHAQAVEYNADPNHAGYEFGSWVLQHRHHRKKIRVRAPRMRWLLAEHVPRETPCSRSAWSECAELSRLEFHLFVHPDTQGSHRNTWFSWTILVYSGQMFWLRATVRVWILHTTILMGTPHHSGALQ